MKKISKRIAVLLAALLLVSVLPVSAAGNDTLKVAVGDMSGTFSPFFSQSAADTDVWSMTQLSLLTSDRGGMPVEKGIKGTKRTYNGKNVTYYGPADLTISESGGKVFYDFTLRTDLTFSDGKKLTADDVIFSMYVLSDPAYDGEGTFALLPIEGMAEYRAGMTPLMLLIYADGENGYRSNSNYTKAQYNAFWTAFNKAGAALVDGIIELYAGSDKKTVAEIAASWGYPLPEGGTKTDFWNAIKEAHRNEPLAWINMETGNSEPFTVLLNGFLGADVNDYLKCIKTGASADRISGIQKIDDYRVRVVLTEKNAMAIYQLGIAIAPLHYYGSTALYDYKNAKFGFEKGDLSSVRAKNGAPMGAGPYTFVSFNNGTVSFAANDRYYKGAPKIRNVRFVTVPNGQEVASVVNGTADIAAPSFTVNTISAIRSANGLPANSAALSGKKITVRNTDTLGYGYIGISADVMNVGGAPGSEASRNLRKAVATVLSVCREEAIASYYGGMAKVIEYPISASSWAAPQPGDTGYKAAFSTDVKGKAIYTDSMSQSQKEAAALSAALEYFKAAGYTVSNGKITKAPAGAKMRYEILVPGDGNGDHPAFAVALKASEALAKIGFTLTVNDLSNSSVLWDALDSGEAAMWCAAWGTTVDPDMYQIYFSGDDTHSPGGSNYMYGINDASLNALILEARSSLDLAYRKQLYRQCLDIITDWAVEIPLYQRQNAVIFSTERIDVSTIPEITSFYGWMSEIETMALKGAPAGSSEAVETQSAVFAAPQLTAGTVLKAVENGARIEKADGSTLKANETVGSGMTLVKADGSRKTIVIKGDNDGDGKITPNDARNALRVAVGLDTPNNWQRSASLVAGGEKITPADARGILRAAVGLDTLSLV